MGIARLLAEERVGAPNRAAQREYEEAEIRRMTAGLDVRDY